MKTISDPKAPVSTYVSLFGNRPMPGRPSEPFDLKNRPISRAIRGNAERRALRVLREIYFSDFLALLDEEIAFLNWDSSQ